MREALCCCSPAAEDPAGGRALHGAAAEHGGAAAHGAQLPHCQVPTWMPASSIIQCLLQSSAEVHWMLHMCGCSPAESITQHACCACLQAAWRAAQPGRARGRQQRQGRRCTEQAARPIRSSSAAATCRTRCSQGCAASAGVCGTGVAQAGRTAAGVIAHQRSCSMCCAAASEVGSRSCRSGQLTACRHKRSCAAGWHRGPPAWPKQAGNAAATVAAAAGGGGVCDAGGG